MLAEILLATVLALTPPAIVQGPPPPPSVPCEFDNVGPYPGFECPLGGASWQWCVNGCNEDFDASQNYARRVQCLTNMAAAAEAATMRDDALAARDACLLKNPGVNYCQAAYLVQLEWIANLQNTVAHEAQAVFDAAETVNEAAYTECRGGCCIVLPPPPPPDAAALLRRAFWLDGFRRRFPGEGKHGGGASGFLGVMLDAKWGDFPPRDMERKPLGIM